MALPIRVLVTLCCLAWPVASYGQQAVFVVRHAEREGEDVDALSEAGKARAKALGELLKTAGVTLVVHSTTDRTRDTAQPLISAERPIVGRPVVKVINTGDSHVEDAYVAIRQAGEKAVVLYVGHSNTVGPLLKKLGHTAEVKLDEKDYGDLFLVVPKEPAPVVLRMRFGD
jgi:phosphohistidine phosphatase SixA